MLDPNATAGSKFHHGGRGRSLFHNSINPLSDNHIRENSNNRGAGAAVRMKSPPKINQSVFASTKVSNTTQNASTYIELLTPTSISMKNAFIIKNAD